MNQTGFRPQPYRRCSSVPDRSAGSNYVFQLSEPLALGCGDPTARTPMPS